ncbi:MULTISPECIES: MAB_1171c family putative transporter [unclassified Streptomyces]|uniref:MAB_1171c family putative transporter n=1 Tax=unclassified Streptomyces TaxID=2593676 RepID=UPI00365551FC
MSPHFHVPYLLPTALLAIALAFKTPTFLRAWRDPDVRATTLLLTWATAVLVVINPINIHRLNVLTGVPNIAAPWAYSFLTAFNATGLTMIIRWREAPSEGRRRRMIRIYWIYAAVGVGLWATFLLAHAPEPRVYDLDTYYACTPWMREHILLYVLAHMVSALVATYMLWRWLPEVTNRWLKTGVVFLQLGFASGLVFDVTKLIAVSARWLGADLDVLSTKAAPPFALMEAILVALGFIAPQTGPALQRWSRDQRDYRRLRSLWRVVRVVRTAAATARLGIWAPVDLRLMQRRQRIHDALRLLAPYLDQGLYQQAYEAAAAAHGADEAHGIAGAVTVQAATDAYRDQTPIVGGRPQQAAPDIADHIDAVSRALSRPRLIGSIRRRVTSTESVTAHA